MKTRACSYRMAYVEGKTQESSSVCHCHYAQCPVCEPLVRVGSEKIELEFLGQSQSLPMGSELAQSWVFPHVLVLHCCFISQTSSFRIYFPPSRLGKCLVRHSFDHLPRPMFCWIIVHGMCHNLALKNFQRHSRRNPHAGGSGRRCGWVHGGAEGDEDRAVWP